MPIALLLVLLLEAITYSGAYVVVVLVWPFCIDGYNAKKGLLAAKEVKDRAMGSWNLLLSVGLL
jgi:hypothetical protein